MAEEAKRAVQRCYPSLLKLLPISKLVEHFYSQMLLSFDQKSKLDSLPSPVEQIKYFLDEILIPGLSIDYTGHFDEMIIMMKKSDDILTQCMVEKLMPEDALAVASTNFISSPLSTPLINDTGMYQLVIVSFGLIKI